MDQKTIEFFLNDLAEFFPYNRPDNENQIQVYTKILSRYEKRLLDKAVLYLIENHQYQRFPLMAEIKAAIGKIVSREKKAGANVIQKMKDESTCQSCNRTGYAIETYAPEPDMPSIYTMARFCACPLGERLRKNFKEYLIRKSREDQE